MTELGAEAPWTAADDRARRPITDLDRDRPRGPTPPTVSVRRVGLSRGWV